MSDLAERRRFALNKKSLRIILAVLLAMFIAMYLLRGWLRVAVIPSYVSATHRQSLQDTFDEVNKELGYPLDTLELNASYVRGNDAECSINTAKNFYVEVGCDVFRGGQGKVIDDAYIQKHSMTIEQLENQLVQSGWRQSQSVDTPSTFIALLMADKQGYAGYIRYDKTIDGNNCWIDLSRFEELGGVLSCHYTSTIGLRS